MDRYENIIEWEGPFSAQTIINDFTDAGNHPYYEGNDYGLYQIYGRHILYGSDALLYIGKATKRSFSVRFAEHMEDLYYSRGHRSGKSKDERLVWLK